MQFVGGTILFSLDTLRAMRMVCARPRARGTLDVLIGSTEANQAEDEQGD